MAKRDGEPRTSWIPVTDRSAGADATAANEKRTGDRGDMADKGVDGATSRAGDWLDARLAWRAEWRRLFTGHRVPRNLNIWYFFGVLATVVLIVQFVSGAFLAMHYVADTAQAFDSIQRIMRDIPWGWLLRYVHTTGASMFFVVLYLHVFRGLLYGSYRRPREFVWIAGWVTLLCTMAESVFGYVLPWGQMSYWGGQVIVNLASVIPGIGDTLALWIRGGYVLSDATLTRFFAWHVIVMPALLILTVWIHLRALRIVGSTNPDGVDIRTEDLARDTVPFFPDMVVKDLLAVALFALVFAWIVFYAPTVHGFFIEGDNALPADPLTTPSDIAPVWYFTPFYAILKAMTAGFHRVLIACVAAVGAAAVISTRARKQRIGRGLLVIVAMLAIGMTQARLWGVVVMLGAVGVFPLLPWLDRSPVRSIRQRPRWQRVVYGVWALSFILLGVLGAGPADTVRTLLAQCAVLVYFAFFALMPWWTAVGPYRAVPERIRHATAMSQRRSVAQRRKS